MPSPSPSSPSVSLPSIHEMFPDHLMNRDDGRRRSHRGCSYPQSPGVHLRHRAPHAHGCEHPDCPRQPHLHVNLEEIHNLPCSSTSSPSSPSSSSPSSSSLPAVSAPRRRSSTVTTSSSGGQNIYAFNVLRSSPTASSLQHITTSSNFPCNNNNTINVNGNGSRPPPAYCVDGGHQHREMQDARSAYPSPSDAYHFQQRDPNCAMHSFPVASAGPLVKQHPQYRSSFSGVSGRVDPSSGYPPHHGQATNILEREDDEGNAAAGSGQEENDPSIGKKHVCPTCFKRFNRPSSLRIHVNTHTGATPFRCPWPNCGREFNVNSNMRRHYRNHTTPGFSRQQQQQSASSSTSAPGTHNGPNRAPKSNSSATIQNNNNNPEGRRKRRRVSVPFPPPPPAMHHVTDQSGSAFQPNQHLNGAGKRTPGEGGNIGYPPYPHPHPHSSSYPDPHRHQQELQEQPNQKYRSEYTYTHPHPHPHEFAPRTEYEYGREYDHGYDDEHMPREPTSAHHRRPRAYTNANGPYPHPHHHPHVYPPHPHSQGRYYTNAESAIPSPPISNLSMSEEDENDDDGVSSVSGDEDASGDENARKKHRSRHRHRHQSHHDRRGGRSYPYSSYSYSPYVHPASNSHHPPYAAAYSHTRTQREAYAHEREREASQPPPAQHRPLTPRSSSSVRSSVSPSTSPSPSASPALVPSPSISPAASASASPLPTKQEHEREGQGEGQDEGAGAGEGGKTLKSKNGSKFKYSASMPYIRSLDDERVSTVLRPAFVQ